MFKKMWDWLCGNTQPAAFEQEIEQPNIPEDEELVEITIDGLTLRKSTVEEPCAAYAELFMAAYDRIGGGRVMWTDHGTITEYFVAKMAEITCRDDESARISFDKCGRGTLLIGTGIGIDGGLISIDIANLPVAPKINFDSWLYQQPGLRPEISSAKLDNCYGESANTVLAKRLMEIRAEQETSEDDGVSSPNLNDLEKDFCHESVKQEEDQQQEQQEQDRQGQGEVKE